MRRWLGVGGLGLLLVLGLGMVLPRRRPVARETPCPIGIYIVGGVIHSDLILPRRNAIWDWALMLPMDQIALGEPDYLGFGFGEQQFYMAPPAPLWQRWPDGLRALFWANPGIVYVYPLAQPPQAAQCIGLQPDQYRQLAQYIQDSFRRDDQGRLQPLGRGHQPVGQFFAARATYSLLFTCNHWTAEGLDRAGVPVPWLPLVTVSLLWHTRWTCPCPQAASS
ncbi:MAG: DUF2459 domain-containing protein [Gloeomargarita sp. GMQP_bins_120]